jgi:hypothetical protein
VTRFRRWLAACWDAIADALESIGDIDDDFFLD